jgi:hypothetical protein
MCESTIATITTIPENYKPIGCEVATTTIIPEIYIPIGCEVAAFQSALAHVKALDQLGFSVTGYKMYRMQYGIDVEWQEENLNASFWQDGHCSIIHCVQSFYESKTQHQKEEAEEETRILASCWNEALSSKAIQRIDDNLQFLSEYLPRKDIVPQYYRLNGCVYKMSSWDRPRCRII